MTRGRPRASDAATDARVAQLAASGLASEAIKAALAAEGKKISKTTAWRRKVEARGGTKKALKRAASAKAEGEDAVARWTTLVERLTAQAERALADDDTSTFNTISRTLNATLVQLAKATPPPAADPNERPDMIAAAARARSKLADYVERVRLGK